MRLPALEDLFQEEVTQFDAFFELSARNAAEITQLQWHPTATGVNRLRDRLVGTAQAWTAYEEAVRLWGEYLRTIGYDAPFVEDLERLTRRYLVWKKARLRASRRRAAKIVRPK